tara:strand:+ start:2755 stop:3522 length:768 start_codon:yes stop_codon:yes gene_type:complete
MFSHAPGLQRITGILVAIASLCVSPAAAAAAQDLQQSLVSELKSQAEAAASTLSWAMADGHPLLLSVDQDRAVLETACHMLLPEQAQTLGFDDFDVLVQWVPVPPRMVGLYISAAGSGASQNPGVSAFADEIGLCMDSTILLQSATARLTPVLFAEHPEWREDAIRLEGLAMVVAGTQQTLLGVMETAAAPGVPAAWRRARLDTILLAAPDIAALLPADLCSKLYDYAHARANETARSADGAEWQSVAEAFACEA